MCQKCNKKSCDGCQSSQSSQLNQSTEALLAELQDNIDILTSAVKAFVCGNPILLIATEDNYQQFDTTGLGSNCWEGWAICNGKSHINPSTKKPFVTPNFTDRFIVQAGGSYALGDVGGEASVTLDITQMPSHNHLTTDTGHTHSITDPGHTHVVSDEGHNHAASGGVHTHTFTTDVEPGHEHSTGTIGITDGGGGTGANVRLSDASPGSSTSTNGEHNHEGITDEAACAVTVSDAYTGVSVNNADTDIQVDPASTGITIGDQGGGLPHNNLPPYFAAFYVIKMW